MWKFCITFASILEIVSWCIEIAYHKSGLILAILSSPWQWSKTRMTLTLEKSKCFIQKGGSWYRKTSLADGKCKVTKK